MQPVIITSHNNHGTYHHYAWSPVLPIFFDMHPLEDPNYRNFYNSVMNYITNQAHLGEVYHTHTDFHCNTINRGPTAYFCIEYDHVISPVFFSVNTIHQHVDQFPDHNTIYVCQHVYV